MKLIHAIVLAPLLLSAPIIAGEPVNIGSRLELMIDDHLIDTMSGGVRLQLHKPVRRNVALVTDEPWEGNACSYCSVFQDGDRYRMYFGSQNYVNTKGKLVNAHEPYTCYAESNDGIHWTKPKLGLIEFDGSKQNNMRRNSIGRRVHTLFPQYALRGSASRVGCWLRNRPPVERGGLGTYPE